LGANVIVNIDGDNQYPGDYIPTLVEPILKGNANMVIGNRQPLTNVNFSPLKQRLEVLGSWFMRLLSDTDVPDAPSGFRAYSRYAALRIQVHNPYSYTLETLIQAGKERFRIAHQPIITNPTTRPSRLHKGNTHFIWRQCGVILRSYILYLPLKTFGMTGFPFFAVGSILLLRFFILYLMNDSGIGRHIQSVSIGGTLFVFGFLLFSLGLLGDGIKANRQLLQEILAQLRDKSNSEYENGDDEILGSSLIKNETQYDRKTD
jgi:glycosyltransferase involved in cell wall biosynthesis